MSFTESIKSCFSNYATFRGRATRSEYWYFALFTFLVALCINALALAIEPRLTILTNIFSLAVFLPSLAVAVRRLHDIGKSGWWYFIAIIPVIGWIWILVLFATASQQEENEYGPVPACN